MRNEASEGLAISDPAYAGPSFKVPSGPRRAGEFLKNMGEHM